jgi:type II secretory pathway component PulF
MAGILEKFNRWLNKAQFDAKRRGAIYRKLATFLKNGVALSSALQIMWDHASDDGKKPNDPSAIALKEWLQKISNGSSVGIAVEGWVPDGDRVVIEAGDKAGSLATAIENAMFIHEAGKKMKSAIIGGLMYPLLLVALAIGFMVLFGVKIVPSFEDVLPREKWTGLAAHMAGVSDFVNHGLMPCLIGAFGIISVVVYSFPRWVGKLRVKFDSYPPWSLYRLSAGAGFMMSTAALVKAGVQIPEILRILQRNASPWYDERMSGALRHVSNGVNLGEALYRTKLGFPDRDTVKDLRSYAELDNFDENLEKLGRQWVEESVDKIKAQTGVLRNAAFVFLGIVFAIIASGIFALQTQVANGLG